MSETGRSQLRAQPDSLQRRVELVIAAGAIIVIALVYTARHLITPGLLTHFDNAPELASLPKRTTSAHKVKGDAINIAIIGSDSELVSAMHLAGWVIADRANRQSDIAIVKSVLFNRADSAAPVSPLYLFGRAQDIAFERQVGRSARSRHHVRFWRANGVTHAGRPVWLGDATFDLRVGVTQTLHPTHHIASDIDEERDTLVANLARAGQVATLFTVSGIGPRVESHNAGGDRFDTDGEIDVVTLPVANAPVKRIDSLPEPPIVAQKDRLWRWAHGR